MLKIYQLHPVHQELRAAESIYGGLEFPSGGARPRDPSRPYVLINMIGSVDGKAVFSGVASGIGSPVDRSVMRSLRSKVDAVMIGAGTLRAEKISLALDDGERRQPLGVVVSSNVERLPLDHLVSLGDHRVLILTTGDGRVGSDSRAETLPTPASDTGDVDLRAALRTLKRDVGVDTVLVEGGPSLNAALFSLSLVDELFLTVAPKLFGGEAGKATTVVEGNIAGSPQQEAGRGLSLVSVFASGDELFLRYATKGTRSAPGSAPGSAPAGLL